MRGKVITDWRTGDWAKGKQKKKALSLRSCGQNRCYSHCFPFFFPSTWMCACMFLWNFFYVWFLLKIFFLFFRWILVEVHALFFFFLFCVSFSTEAPLISLCLKKWMWWIISELFNKLYNRNEKKNKQMKEGKAVSVVQIPGCNRPSIVMNYLSIPFCWRMGLAAVLQQW